MTGVLVLVPGVIALSPGVATRRSGPVAYVPFTGVPVVGPRAFPEERL